MLNPKLTPQTFLTREKAAETVATLTRDEATAPEGERWSYRVVESVGNDLAAIAVFDPEGVHLGYL